MDPHTNMTPTTDTKYAAHSNVRWHHDGYDHHYHSSHFGQWVKWQDYTALLDQTERYLRQSNAANNQWRAERRRREDAESTLWFWRALAVAASALTLWTIICIAVWL